MRSLLALSLAVSALLLTACHSSGGYLRSDPGLVYGPGVVEFPNAERVYLPTYRRAAAAASIGVRTAGAHSAHVNFLARTPPAPDALPRAWSQRDQWALRAREADCSGQCGAFDCPTLTRPEELCWKEATPVVVAPPPVQRQTFRAPPARRGGNCGSAHRHNSTCHRGAASGPAFTRDPGQPLPPPVAAPPPPAPDAGCQKPVVAPTPAHPHPHPHPQPARDAGARKDCAKDRGAD